MDSIRRTIEEFHACTQLVARAFDRFGNCIMICSSADNRLCCVPQWRATVFEALEQLYTEKPGGGYITRSCTAEQTGVCGGPFLLHFTVCYVDAKMPELGAVAFGPYIQEASGADFPVKPLHVVGYLVELLQMISRSNLMCASSLQPPSSYSYRVRLAIDYIRQQLPESVTLAQTAAQIQTDKTYLSRLFRKETGMTFSAYINYLRVEQSRSLLVNPALSLLDIALAVGFNDQSYFNRVFKRVMGITPQAYRENTVCTMLP